MRKSDLCERVLAYMELCDLNELGTLSVKRLAERFRVSRFHLSHCLKQKQGIALARHLLSLKMQKLAEWLQERERVPVAEMSQKVGLYSPKYFSRRFKQFFGIVPSMYHSNGQYAE